MSQLPYVNIRTLPRLLDLQVHLLQQDDEPAVWHSRSLRQGHGRIHSHVLHRLLGFLPIGLLGFRNPGKLSSYFFCYYMNYTFIKLLS